MTVTTATCPVLVPDSYAEAAQHLHDIGPDTRILAGGQSLAVLMRLGMAEPEALISLRRCPEALTAPSTGGVTHVGARFTTADVAARLRGVAPAVADAAGQVASPHVRNIGTVVGNVCHADPGNDLTVPLLCHDPSVVVASIRGRRVLALTDLLSSPYELTLEEDEFVLRLDLPELAGWAGAYRKIVWRAADHPVAGAAAVARLVDGRVAEVRIALGGALGVPARLPGVEAALCDCAPAEAATLARAAAAAEVADLPVLGGDDDEMPAGYRRRVAAAVVGDAVAAAIADGADR